jgi:hypothetical protein
MNRSFILLIGFLLLFATEIMRVYFIMPFPGSQHANTIRLAYFLNKNINWIRLLGWIITLPPLIYFLSSSKPIKKVGLLIIVLLFGIVFYLFNFRFLADKMFYQPTNKLLFEVNANKVDTNQLVIGAIINGQASAYPVQVIGYHHQVQDSIGGEPVLVTYCTVCRTGRVFSPMVNGKYQHFRLVGMDHFNAMFEDETTGSWWRQVTGEAIAGPSKGTSLKELPSIQIRLGAWIREHPQTRILQPDTIYKKQYADLEGYDSGTIKSSLEKRDSSSWKFKSWVIGVSDRGRSKAYDWNELTSLKVVNDSIGDIPIVLILETDGLSFHAWNRMVNGQALIFDLNKDSRQLEDRNTLSIWDWDGVCREGKLIGSSLLPVQAYQEFWHSWQSFHPNTTKYQMLP